MVGDGGTDGSTRRIFNPRDTLCTVLLNRAAENADIVHAPDDCRSSFDSVATPSCPLRRFVRRLTAKAAADCCIHSLVLVDRLCRAANVCVTERNVHRLWLTAFTIASKLRNAEVDDPPRAVNGDVARRAGISAADLSTMESHFLHLVDWEVRFTEAQCRYVAATLGELESSHCEPEHVIPDTLLSFYSESVVQVPASPSAAPIFTKVHPLAVSDDGSVPLSLAPPAVVAALLPKPPTAPSHARPSRSRGMSRKHRELASHRRLASSLPVVGTASEDVMECSSRTR